ncbi:hypothetical protein NBM05_05725 [Rothia sp. AR01]|uniref:Uncharacterized protein n=1 Tax=Rothia santali TaxID=2949643 RepID=A0A9X2HA60_9MICC|nr:hypothetical protein [Rothia santali]MCP3425526.1 hypothetical protein [Rothia santali]
MTQAIQLGAVLGGRYKVTTQVVATAAQDQVLEGRDQVLGRRVSILVASAAHSDLLIEHAREVAAGPRAGNLQILDLGQSEDVTYLITSHAPANELLDLLLTEDFEPEDPEGLGTEIFGSSTAATDADYEQLGTDTSPQSAVSGRSGDTGPMPAVQEWSEADYEAFGEEPPAQRQPRAGSSDGTLFDRAASDASGGTAGVAGAAGAASAFQGLDAGYDGDNRYEPEEEDFIPGVQYEDEEERPRRRRAGGGLWITAVVVVVLLVGLAIFGFTRLGSLVAGFADPSPSGTVSSAPEGPTSSPSASASPSPTGGAGSPEISGISRVVPGNVGFMGDQDGTLGLATDGDPSTSWSSYGFSSASFGNLVPGVGLAVELQQPSEVSSVTVGQDGGTGGQFTVYTSDSPSIEGATEAGTGTLDGPSTTVDLSDQASSEDASYVIVYFTQAAQLSEPIAGYSYGLRINDISVE